MMLGGSFATLVGATLEGGGAGAASLSYALTSGGNTTINEMGSAQDIGKWLFGDVPSNFEVFCTDVGAGGGFTGPTGVWTVLTSGVTWAMSVPDGNYGLHTHDLTLELRRVGTSTVIATALVHMELEGIL